jgi:hypothetical protein
MDHGAPTRQGPGLGIDPRKSDGDGATAHRRGGSAAALRRRGGRSDDQWCSTNCARETGSSEKEGGPRWPQRKKSRETAVVHRRR